MIKRLHGATAAALLCFLNGCASYATTEVTAFSNWTGRDTDKTYAFQRSPAQQHNLEQQTYEGLVADELSIAGFTLTSEARAHYWVSLHYESRDKSVIVRQPVYEDLWPVPAWGWRSGPWWGPPLPLRYVEQNVTVFVHRLTIRIIDRATGDEVYRVTASNASANAAMIATMPYLVRSALADFPLANGTVRQVRLPVDNAAPKPASAPAASAAPTWRPMEQPSDKAR